jgi:D-alanyl-D-alanine carboxypeptidase
MDEVDFSGTISLFDGDREIETVCAGFADIANARPNGPRTKFGMASGSKAFTAAGILRLVEDGAFSLDTKANELIGDYRVHDAITIGQILTHSSGIRDYFDEETMDDYEELWKDRPSYGMREPEDFLPLFVGLPGKFEPGERFGYSNSGYVLLAYIIERITREPFPDHIRKAVFEKCGMASTGYFRLDAPDTATGYIREGDSYRSNIYSIPPIGGGDGGCYTNGEDMNRFWRALASGALLRPEGTAAMLAIQVAETGDEKDRYGLGIWIDEADEDLVFVQGFDPGTRFLSYFRRSSGKTLTICANKECKLGAFVRDYKPRLK